MVDASHEQFTDETETGLLEGICIAGGEKHDFLIWFSKSSKYACALFSWLSPQYILSLKLFFFFFSRPSTKHDIFYSYQCGKLEEGCTRALKTCALCGLGPANVEVSVEKTRLMGGGRSLACSVMKRVPNPLGSHGPCTTVSISMGTSPQLPELPAPSFRWN